MTVPHRSRAAAAAACLLIAAAATSTAAPTAAASPAPVDPTPVRPAATSPAPAGYDAVRADQQHRLDLYAERIRGAAADQTTSGFAGLSVDPDKSRLDVWWHGSVPRNVSRLISGPPAGLEVRLHAARFSQQELDRAAERLLAAPSRSRTAAAHTTPLAVHGVVVRHDGSGLEVRYNRRTATTPTTGKQPRTSAAYTTAAYTAAVRRLSSTPEVASALEQAPPVPAASKPRWTRLNDDVSWRGGSLIKIYRDISKAPDILAKLCTSAFAVRRNNTDRPQHLLTAAHCAGGWATNRLYTKDYDGQKIASTNRDAPSIAVNRSLDSAIIRVNESVRGEIYTGHHDRVRDGWWKFVIGSQANNVGDYVQSGGGNSGEHAVRIKNDRVRGTTTPSQSKTFFVEAAAMPEERWAAVSGDSGGPVFDYSGRSINEVYARGVIWYTTDLVSCSDKNPNKNLMVSWSKKTDCGRTVGYVPIRPILKAWNATLVTR